MKDTVDIIPDIRVRANVPGGYAYVSFYFKPYTTIDPSVALCIAKELFKRQLTGKYV